MRKVRILVTPIVNRWQEAKFSELKNGDIFEILESDGLVVKDQYGRSRFHAVSDPYINEHGVHTIGIAEILTVDEKETPEPASPTHKEVKKFADVIAMEPGEIKPLIAIANDTPSQFSDLELVLLKTIDQLYARANFLFMAAEKEEKK